MYNESGKLFCKTMHSVMQNIAHLCATSEEPWGPEGWRKVVICIVSDGREKLQAGTQHVLTNMGLYDGSMLEVSAQ